MALTVATAAGAAGGGYQLAAAIMQVYSKEIYFWAQPVLKFDQFVVRKEELGVAPGLTVNILRYNNLPQGGVLVEGTRMSTKTLSGSQIAVTVVEHGNAIGVTELMLQTSFDDVMSSGSNLLGKDYGKVLDAELRDTYIGCQNVQYAGNAAGRTAIVAANTMDTQLVKNGVETLKTNDAPMVGTGYYACFSHPHQLRGMRDDPAWISASHYGAAEQIFKGEVGRYEDTIFIETTQMPNGVYVNTAAAPNQNTFGYNSALDPNVTNSLNTTIYQAVMFGDNAVGLATSLPVEMRDNGITDFGREHGLAWYGIYGTAILTNPNIVRLETA
jgi:N4-gp56 family major capsid protein